MAQSEVQHMKAFVGPPLLLHVRLKGPLLCPVQRHSLVFWPKCFKCMKGKEVHEKAFSMFIYVIALYQNQAPYPIHRLYYTYMLKWELVMKNFALIA